MTTANEKTSFRCALEVNSFYDPGFWGLDDFMEILNPTLLPTTRFWDVALAKLNEYGISGVEMTFGPGSYESVLNAYHSAAAFRGRLEAEGQVIAAGFYSGLFDDKPCSADYTEKWKTEARQSVMMHETERYAEFLGEVGCGVMTIGLPMRKQWDAPDPTLVDAEYVKRLMELVHRIGRKTAQNGVRLALHPECNSVFWYRRDIRLLMDYADPVYIDFCPDLAHIRAGGADPVQVVAEHAERMKIFHWKDCLAEVPQDLPTEGIIFKTHAPYFTTPGRGIVDGVQWAKLLDSISYRGWCVLEVPASLNLTEIDFALAYLKKEIVPVFG